MSMVAETCAHPIEPAATNAIGSQTGKTLILSMESNPPSGAELRGVRSLRHAHGLNVDKLTKSAGTKFATVSRSLHAAERQSRIGRYHRVDEDHAGFDLVDEAGLLGVVGGPDTGAETEFGIVGDADGVVDVVGAKQDGHGSEEFFDVGGGIAGDIGEHGGGIVVEIGRAHV